MSIKVIGYVMSTPYTNSALDVLNGLILMRTSCGPFEAVPAPEMPSAQYLSVSHSLPRSALLDLERHWTMGPV